MAVFFASVGTNMVLSATRCSRLRANLEHADRIRTHFSRTHPQDDACSRQLPQRSKIFPDSNFEIQTLSPPAFFQIKTALLLILFVNSSFGNAEFFGCGRTRRRSSGFRSCLFYHEKIPDRHTAIGYQLPPQLTGNSTGKKVLGVVFVC